MEKNTFEIPFGAKDSELGGFEYIIPEGYEAEIKDGKVIVRKSEGDDEKTRKALIKFLTVCDEADERELQPYKKMIDWVEKHGDEKPVVDINPIEFESRLNALLKQFEKLPKEELASSLSFYLNVVQNDGTYKNDEKQGEKKPTDKVPKFKVGDKIIEKDYDECGCGTIIDIKDGKYIFDNGGFIYIEEQGLWKLVEQNPADKVEPKFHEGDWVIDKQGIAHQIANVIENVTNHTYGYDIVGGGYFNENNEGVRLWTIEDAKPGDVLSSGKMIVIFKHFEEPSYRQRIVAYIGLDRGGDIQITNDTWSLGIDKAELATKEQRDLLFQKIKESGYEWDVEKKELKKIEQNPAWSEEDEEMLKSIIATCEFAEQDRDSLPARHLFKMQDNWLKSIKDRVQPLPKQEWSKKDEDMLQSILDEYKSMLKEKRNWLKSFKDRHTWKPSDEQMEALDIAIDEIRSMKTAAGDEVANALSSLYEQLKAL